MDNLKRSFEPDQYGPVLGRHRLVGKQAGGFSTSCPPPRRPVRSALINRATFSFWRNQQTSGAKTTTAFDNLKASMRSIYNLCSNGPGQETPGVRGVARVPSSKGTSRFCRRTSGYVRDHVNDKLVSGYKGTHIMFKDIPLAYDNACPRRRCTSSIVATCSSDGCSG
jgi:hypothetical protein